MKPILFLLATALALPLYGQNSLLMDKVRNLTGLEENNFLIQGFLSTDRAQFLPGKYVPFAYDPVDIPLRKGVAALSPHTLVTILLKAGLEEDHRVLIVGEEGSYCATALSRAGMDVYLIDPTAEASSAYQLKKDGGNLNGWISMAPFDFIFLINARESVPSQLLRQLSLRGILLIPLITDDLVQCWCRVGNSSAGLDISLLESVSLFPLF